MTLDLFPTRPPAHKPSLVTTASVHALIPHLVSPLPASVRLLDARAPSLYQVEHITHATLPPAKLCSLQNHIIFVYDAGARHLHHFFTRAVALVTHIHADCPSGTCICLLQGGIAEMRTQMPRCIQLGSMHACMRGKGLVDANARKWALGAARHLEMTGREPGCVEGFVWIGAMVHVCDVRLLRRLGVTHVLSVCEQMVDVPGDMVYEWYKTEDVCTFDISKHFEKAVRFLRDVRRRGGVVLVHCYAGSSRSVAIVAAYMVWCGWDLQAALREIRGVREAACPNEGFLERLAEWEREIGRRRDEEVEMCGSTRLDIPCVKRGRDPILQGMSPVTPDETPSLFSTNVPTSAYIACQKRL